MKVYQGRYLYHFFMLNNSWFLDVCLENAEDEDFDYKYSVPNVNKEDPFEHPSRIEY